MSECGYSIGIYRCTEASNHTGPHRAGDGAVMGEAKTGDQPMPSGAGDSVTAEVRRLLDAREAKGVATYGRSLTTHNGRDACRDLAEELLDGAQYAIQWQMERRDLLERVARTERDLQAAVEDRDSARRAFAALDSDFRSAREDRKNLLSENRDCRATIEGLEAKLLETENELAGLRVTNDGHKTTIESIWRVLNGAINDPAHRETLAGALRRLVDERNQAMRSLNIAAADRDTALAAQHAAEQSLAAKARECEELRAKHIPMAKAFQECCAALADASVDMRRQHGRYVYEAVAAQIDSLLGRVYTLRDIDAEDSYASGTIPGAMPCQGPTCSRAECVNCERKQKHQDSHEVDCANSSCPFFGMFLG